MPTFRSLESGHVGLVPKRSALTWLGPASARDLCVHQAAVGPSAIHFGCPILFWCKLFSLRSDDMRPFQFVMNFVSFVSCDAPLFVLLSSEVRLGFRIGVMEMAIGLDFLVREMAAVDTY